MKKKWLAIFSFVLLVFLCITFIGKNTVFADGEGESSGHTAEGKQPGASDSGGTASYDAGSYGNSSCPSGWAVCTGYGATWRYYPWAEGKTEEVIQGYGTSWAAGAVIKDNDATVCAQAGGYFRYAMVEPNSGAQRGTMAFGTNSGAFKSSLFGGGLFYRGPNVANGGEDFSVVQNAYNMAKQIPGNNLSCATLDANCGTAWFCATYDGGTPCVTGDPNCPQPPPTDSECPGIAVPDGYAASTVNSGWSSVRTQVRKLSTFGSFTNELWAKPGDVVQWRHCYFPGMQKVSNQVATSKDNEPSVINYPVSNSNAQLPDAQKQFPLISYKSTVHGIKQWGNIYNITNKDGDSSDLPFNPTDESRALVKKLDNNWTVDQGWVGGSFEEKSNLDTIALGDKNPSHAEASGKPVNHDWTCSWTHPITYYGDERYEHSECYYWDDAEECSVSIKNVCTNSSTFGHNPSESEKCGCSGGEMVETKVKVLYDGTCESTITDKYVNGCNHGSDSDGWYYPSKATRDMYLGDKRSETATVKVPYNYEVTGSAVLGGNYVYAGETATIESGEVRLIDKYNGLTNGTYIAGNPEVNANWVTFISKTADGSQPITSPREVKAWSGELKPDKTSESFKGRTVNVDDTVAGNYFCVALHYSPTTSGSDDNISNKNGTGDATSAASCKQIAKKPSVQIWGGNLFSNGNVNTARSKKNNLSGFTDRPYEITGVNDENVFGSWAEHSVMTISTNTGFASGAATSNRLGDTGSHGVGRFESKTGGFCKYEVPLTFANLASKKGESICGGTTTSTAGLFGTAVVADKSSYVESLLNGKDKLDSTPYKNDISNYHMTLGQDNTYSIIKTATGKEILVTKYNGDKSIGIDVSNIDLKKTYVVYSNKTVYINGNITYANGATDSDSIPKVVIYSKGNIGIKCGVTRIDAVIISEGTVITCVKANGAAYNNKEELNVAERSTPLMINGTIIANSVSFTRTYGGSIGTYSGIPAEVVNYDSSLVMWGREHADTSQTGVMTTTYTRELAPRY